MTKIRQLLITRQAILLCVQRCAALPRSPFLPGFVGLFLTLPPLMIAALLPDPRAREWLSMILAVVAAIYVGFALMDTRPRQLFIELSFASMTLMLTLAGLWGQPWILAVGYFLHGLWDLLHQWRRPVIDTRLPWWYAFFCLTFDLPVAAYVLWRWH